MGIVLVANVQAQSISHSEFIRGVIDKNTNYLAEKYNIDIAMANLQAAKVFNDPELSVEYGNNQDWNLQMGQSVDVGLSYDLDIAGVRKARIRTARSEKEVTEASVAAFLSNLRLEAAQAWTEAWGLKNSCELMSESVKAMNKIAQSDSIRLSVGDIGATDATQSRLEAETLRGELIDLQAKYANALMTLSMLCGGNHIADIAEDSLPLTEIKYSEEEIFRMAENNRADLRAAELSQTLSENNLKLVKATRRMEMNLSVGYSYNTEVRNEIAPAPKFNGLSIGISIPLKFSSMNKGEKRAAQHQVQQSQLYYESARLQVHTEAAQAYNSLQAAQRVYEKYQGSMLKDAKQVVESRTMGYLEGESSLLELLSAQQTYRDVMQAYIDACSNLYVCQAQLEYAMGISK